MPKLTTPWRYEADTRLEERRDHRTPAELVVGWNVYASDGSELIGIEGIAADGEDIARDVVRAVNAYDDMRSALAVVRMSAGWSIMSDETRQLVIAALAKAENVPA